MELGKELQNVYTTADYLYFPSNENKNMFSSAFLFQNFLMVFLIFKMLCTQKQVDTNHVFYLVMLREIKSCEKYNSWQKTSSKKGQSGLHYQLLTFNFMARSMVTKYLVSKGVIHNIKGFNATILAHFSAEQ